jgi:hypothetical protein
VVAAEAVTEVGVTGKTTAQRNVRDGQIRALQQLTRPRETALGEITMGRHSGGTTECSCEESPAHANFLGQFLE